MAERSLAHIEKIAWVKPIEGADNIELIGILGWNCIAKKGEFKEGSWCCYFEIDSKLPEKEWSEFMRSKHFKVKTLEGFGLTKKLLSVAASGALMWYLNETQKNDLNHISGLKYYTTGDFMLLDVSSRRNLELTETLREKNKKGSLLIDLTNII